MCILNYNNFYALREVRVIFDTLTLSIHINMADIKQNEPKMFDHIA